MTGDVGETAQALHHLVALRNPESRYRRPDVQQRIAEEGRWVDVPIGDDLSTAETIDPRVLSRELERRLPRERMVAVDSGNFMGYPAAYLSVPDPAGFCFTQSFQAIGLGLGSAIGAALASPGRLPVLATGDGGFLMAIAELETAVRLGLGLRDHRLQRPCVRGRGAPLRAWSPRSGRPRDGDLPRHRPGCRRARLRCDALTVRAVDDLDPLTEWLAGPRNRPLLIDAKISSDGGSWWLAEAFRGH